MGASIAVNTIIKRTNAAEGTEAEDMEAAVEVKNTVTIPANPSSMPLICAINIAATEI